MNTPNVPAGRLKRRVGLVGRETMPSIHGFCSFFPFGAIRGVPLLRPTALGGWTGGQSRWFSVLALCLYLPFCAMRGKPLIAPYGPYKKTLTLETADVQHLPFSHHVRLGEAVSKSNCLQCH